MDHLIFALNGIGAALRHLIIGQQLFHLTAHQADVVAIGDLGGDGDGTGLIFTVDGGSGRGLGHCGDLGKADLAFLLVFGTGQAELLQRFPGGDTGAIGDDHNRQVTAVYGDIGGGGLGENGGGHLLVDLRDRQVVLGGFGFIHGDAHLGAAVLLPITDRSDPFHGGKGFGQVGGGGPQGIHIIAGDGQLNTAAAGHHTHIHGGAVGGNGAVQIGAGFLDLFGDLLAGIAAVITQQHIDGQAAAAHAHHALALHGADGIHPIHGKDPLQDGIAHGPCFALGGVLRHLDGDRHLWAIHFRHKGGAHADRQHRAGNKQRHRAQQNRSLVPQYFPQKVFVARYHAVQETVGLFPCGIAGQYFARKGGHQGKGDQQTGTQ